MVNAIHLWHKLNNMPPISDRPKYTEKYEGFFHLIKFNGSPEEGSMEYIVRDHYRVKFEDRKKRLEKNIDYLNEKYGAERFILVLQDQSYNMLEKIEEVCISRSGGKSCRRSRGLTSEIIPVRGGTDGSRLSYIWLPCSNIFNRHHNWHGRYAYVPLEFI